MKSTISLIIAGLASTVVAQPLGHAAAHQHPGRAVNQHHQHAHDRRYLKTEYEVVWVTETVTEVIDGTSTEWFTADPTTPATTLATVTTTPKASSSSSAASSSSTSAGEFFEGATTSSTSSTIPTYSSSSSSSTSVYVAPAPTTTIETPVAEPTTTSAAPVEETPTTTTEAPAATTTTEAAAAAATTAASSSSSNTDSTSSTLSGTSFSGKITWIGDTTGALSACGAPYESGSMYVAVDPDVLDCGSGTGTTMSITANGKTVSAYAIDKCMGCTSGHIDVATAVYEALGYTTDDGGMHDSGGISWIISLI